MKGHDQRQINHSRPGKRTVKPYRVGSLERKQLEEAIAHLKAEKTQIPLVINGEHIYTDSKEQVICPHDHKHVLAELATKEHAQLAIDAALNARRAGQPCPGEPESVFLKAAEPNT